MSNEREIRLVGSFKDDITPKLQRLNKQIAATVRQFERLQKRLRPIAKEMGVLAMASERVGNSLRAQRTGFESNIRAMRAYRSEMGRTVAAQRRLMGRTALPQITAAPRVRPSGGTRGGFAGGGGGGGGSAYVHPRQRMSRGGVASTYAPSAQRMPSGGGGGVGIADGAAGAAFGITLGNQIGSIMTNAVMTGFHKGVELMQKPFKFLAHEFRHAMQEEMADITAAGAMFALDKAGKTGMFKDFEDARMAQEMLDQRLALSAGRLPGETLQYVQQARQLQDTIMQAMGRDKEGFIKHAEKLGAVPGDMRDAFATVLAQFTERAVLLGMGGGGTGGLGVPQLLEQMVGQEAVRVQSMGMRYSALRTNPLLKAALERNEAAINATTVGTIERINAIQKALDEALPQEVITAMTMTMNGIAEGFRSSIFDIAAGWFGVRRMMKGVEAATYKMSGEIKQATNSTLSLFDVLRDTIGFFVVPLLELTSILPEIYEPFEGLVNTLVPLRAIGARFTFTFNQFAADYEAFAKEAFPDDFDKQTAFLKNRGPRAALRSIAALLEDFDPGFSADEVSRELLKVDADFGKVAKDMITSLLDSDFMEMVGETMGNFVSELLTVMANLVTGATDFATTSRFAKGFSKGLQGRLDEAGEKLGMGAFEAIRKIFEGVFRVMGRLLLTIVTQLPMETMLFVGITAVLPAALAALGTKIGMTLSAVLGKAGGMIQASLMGTKVAGAGAATTAAATGGTAHAALTGKAAAGAAGAGAKAGIFAKLTPLLALLGKFALVMAAVVGVVGLFVGFENAIRGFKIAMDELMSAIGGTIGPIFSSLGDIVGSLLQSFFSLVAIIVPFGSSMGGAASETDKLKAAVIAFKVILTPVVAAFQLVEQVLNLVVAGLKGLELAILYARMGLAQLNPFGSEEKRQKLVAAISRVESELDGVNGKFKESFDRHSQWYTTEIEASAQATAALKNVADSASQAAGDLTQYQQKTRELIAQGKASGLTPTAADMAWYNEQMAKTRATTGIYGTAPATAPASAPSPAQVAASPIPAIQALNTKQAEANTLLAQINAKTLPQQQVNPIPQLQTIGTGLSGASALIAQVKAQVATSGKEVKAQVGASSNSVQTKIQSTTTAVNSLSNRFTAGMPVRIVGTPTVKFDTAAIAALGRGFEAGKKVARAPQPTAPSTAPRFGFNAAGGNFSTPLGKAISSEMRQKPPGSDLVIANSSETIIPKNYTKDVAGLFGLFGGPATPRPPLRYGDGAPPSRKPAKGWAADEDGAKILELLGGTRIRGAADGMIGPSWLPWNWGKLVDQQRETSPLNRTNRMLEQMKREGRYDGGVSEGGSGNYMRSSPVPTMVASAGGSEAGNITTGPITISVDGYDKDPRELTEIIASQLVTAMYKQSRSEVLTS